MRCRGTLLLALVAIACDRPSDQPGVIVLPGMAFTIPYDAYDANPITGQTLLVPPLGTVPYGFHPFAYAPGPEEAIRAGRELSNPLDSLDAAVFAKELVRGKKVYDIFCLVCHGPGGDGDGPIIGRFPNPPSLLAEPARKMGDGEIYHRIVYGQKLMPGYAVQVQPADRWRLTSYIRRLQADADARAAAEAKAASSNAALAKQAGETP